MEGIKHDIAYKIRTQGGEKYEIEIGPEGFTLTRKPTSSGHAKQVITGDCLFLKKGHPLVLGKVKKVGERIISDIKTEHGNGIYHSMHPVTEILPPDRYFPGGM